MDGLMDGCILGSIDGWIDGRREEGQMYVCIDR
jgi:hypothetical protein